MKRNNFYYCEKCGRILHGMDMGESMPNCCGDGMREMEPVTDDAGREKHAPVVDVDGNIVTVSVGKNFHPMSEEHKILWVYLRTDKGGQYKRLEIGKEPTVSFALIDETPDEVLAYCSLHGLWKTEI